MLKRGLYLVVLGSLILAGCGEPLPLWGPHRRLPLV